MELGLYTFAETEPGPEATARRLRQLLAEAELADRLGLDVFGVGEHHRVEYAVSAPAIALAAIAARTERIRLTSAVTVLSSDDPIRVFQDFATIDLLSGGRAEIMAGRGSFVESFPLFGQDLDDYDELFAAKLELLLAARSAEHVSWPGSRHRAAIEHRGVYPRPLQDPLPVWVAVGGSPPSVIRAARLGLPIALAIIGGQPRSFAPLFDLHRQVARESGHGRLPVSVNSHTYVADTPEQARREFFPSYAQTMSALGRERGWPPLTRAQFEQGCGPHGHLFVGSPADVADKIVAQHGFFGHDRFLAQMTVGVMPAAQTLRSIELFASEVAPAVRERVAAAAPASSA